MSELTTHNENVQHGYSTPHKYPSDSTLVTESLRDLSLQLYPTGRAWYMPENGIFQKFHDALNLSFARVLLEGQQTIDSTFPDNENFSVQDAELWEVRLGLITNESLSLDTRKLAIKRRLSYPNNIKARQHPFFIESQLQAAGFDVYVHENTFPYQAPGDIIAISLNNVQHGGDTQHGNSQQHGGDNFDVIANSVNPLEDFAIGSGNLWSTFFIGGVNLGDMASVPSSRVIEFRELVLKLKPAHTAAFTFINYI